MSKAKEHGIQKLNDYQHARLRCEMYLGSRSVHTQSVLMMSSTGISTQEFSWVPALFTAFREALDNAMDEVIGHNSGNEISVYFDEATMSFTISDNGRGIPFDFDETHGKHIATMVLSETKTGRNFGERGNVGGTNGLGISIVNFCSQNFMVEIHRGGKVFEQTFREDDYANYFIEDVPKITKGSKTKTGTIVNFILSPKVFPAMTLPEAFVEARVNEIAYNNPKVKFSFNGKKIDNKEAIEKRIFGKEKPILFEIQKPGFDAKFYVKPNFVESGDFSHSLVNRIPAFNGGPHMDTFRRMFISGILSALEGQAKRKKLKPNRSDISEGLLFYNVTTMDAPNFDSQSKTRLTNEEAGKYVSDNLTADFFEKTVKAQKDWVEQIFERCAQRTNQKDADELDREERKLLKKKISKLTEANSRNRKDCILIIAEGDSAISGLSAVRDPDIHAGLPLRGKILNVHGEDPKKLLENDVISDLMSVVGLSLTKKAKREDLRYGKIYVATDADEDGKSIAALVVNFFYQKWPELFADKENPFINVFFTPLIIAEKGSTRKYWYQDDYDKFKPEEHKGWNIIRAKGLATLVDEDWSYSLATPKLFPIVEDGNLQETLDLIFNKKRADDRKIWLSGE